jgi:polyisoprenoid-binding protein YceI
MKLRIHAAVVAILMAGFLSPAEVRGQKHTIDGQHSAITIHVFKSGLFSAFAHNHEIRTSIARGDIEASGNSSVELWVDTSKLRVVDSGISAKDRTDIQKTMEGPEVLDVSRFPQVHFHSTSVKKTGASRWIVRGNLDLRGKSRPVEAEVAETNGRYRGSATLKQRDFGIAPVKIAGGTVRVKDEVKIEFEIATVP